MIGQENHSIEMAKQRLEVSTDQNITIEYELAPAYNRLIAGILDGVLVLIWFMISNSIGNSLDPDRSTLFQANLIILPISMTIPAFLIFSPVLFFYNFFCELFFNGQSLGKKIMGIRVMSLHGKKLSVGQCAVRWGMRLIDIFLTAAALAYILISSSSKKQRLGDMSANTIVIASKGSANIRLTDLLSIKDSSNYTPQYPQVTMFNDEDMLLVKNSIDRLNKFPNEAHKQVALELIEKICKMMGIEAPKKNKLKFLKKVLEDYIVLTRS